MATEDDRIREMAAEYIRQSEQLRTAVVPTFDAVRAFMESLPEGRINEIAEQVRTALSNTSRIAEAVATVAALRGTGTLSAGGVTRHGAATLSATATLTATGSVLVPLTTPDVKVVAGTAAVTSSASGAITIVKAEDVGGLVRRLSRQDILGYSVIQILVLLLICTIVFGLPYLEKALPPGAAAQLTTDQDGIDFVLALIGGAVAANRKPRQ